MKINTRNEVTGLIVEVVIGFDPWPFKEHNIEMAPNVRFLSGGVLRDVGHRNYKLQINNAPNMILLSDGSTAVSFHAPTVGSEVREQDED